MAPESVDSLNTVQMAQYLLASSGETSSILALIRCCGSSDVGWRLALFPSGGYPDDAFINGLTTDGNNCKYTNVRHRLLCHFSVDSIALFSVARRTTAAAAGIRTPALSIPRTSLLRPRYDESPVSWHPVCLRS